MLFDEYGGYTYKYGCQRENYAPATGAEMFAVPGGGGNRHGAYDVNRGADVCVGVKLIKPGDKSGKSVVVLELKGAKPLGGGIEEIDNHCDRIGYHNKIHQFPEAFHVEKERVNMYPDEIDEPEEIGNEENFAEGDKVVDGGIHKVKVFRNAAALNERKENSEHRPEKEKPKVAKLR